MNMNVHLSKPIRYRFTIIGLAALALVLIAGTSHALPAQSNPAGTASAASAGTAAVADSTQEKQAAQAKPASQPPTAPGEGLKLGAYEVHTSFEVGYRWSPGIDGNDQMYRSQVNLYQGTRLFNSYLTMRSTPGTGVFDKLDLSVNNLGDPYDTLRFTMSRMDAYQFRASYRDMNYFNYISNFANPLLGQGSLLPQHNLNVNYRMSDFELRLIPNRKIVPFVGYSRNTGTGPGYTTVGMTGNQFLLKTQWDYSADEFRGGVQFNLPTLNLTVEQGYRQLKNRTSVNDAGQPQGNQTLPFFGQNVTLSSLTSKQYGRMTLPTTRILAKFTPYANLRMIGRYLYTMGDTEATLGEQRTGNLVSLEDFLAYGAANDSLRGRAKKPNHNGYFLIEYSPFSRLTLMDTVDTLDYHISSSGLLSTLYIDASSLLGPGSKSTITVNNLLNTEFIYNQVRNQAEFEFDLSHGLALHAGHRYTFTNVSTDDSEDTQESSMSRQTALFGIIYRPIRKVRFGIDYENTQSNQPLTRTDLFDYDQFNVDWRFGAWKGFSIFGRLALRRNTDDGIDINFRSRDWNFSGGLSWEMSDRLSLNADYSRTDLYSAIDYVIPQNFRTDRSIFDERISGIGGHLGIGIYRGSKAEIGYRGIISRGSNPLEFHQPYGSVLIPLGGGLAFKPAWQYFGYSEKNFGMENYKTHMMTFSLVYTR